MVTLQAKTFPTIPILSRSGGGRFYAKNDYKRSWVRICVEANSNSSHKKHQKRKINAECSKINCKCHRKLSMTFYIDSTSQKREFYAIVLWVKALFSCPFSKWKPKNEPIPAQKHITVLHNLPNRHVLMVQNPARRQMTSHLCCIRLDTFYLIERKINHKWNYRQSIKCQQSLIGMLKLVSGVGTLDIMAQLPGLALLVIIFKMWNPLNDLSLKNWQQTKGGEINWEPKKQRKVWRKKSRKLYIGT
jgi:hypothetical protein